MLGQRLKLTFLVCRFTSIRKQIRVGHLIRICFCYSLEVVYLLD